MMEFQPIVKAYSYTRFSSEQQREGDSLRRQIEAAENWCRTEGGGLPLDTSLRDMAVPGFRGRNAKVGALGKFLRAIDEGMVASGSVLIVENLDRLSRNEPLEGLDSLKTIINAGVDVVTLMDRQRYTRENMRRDLGKLLGALVILCRGFEESDSKSRRLMASWAQKRKAARAGKPLTVRVPPWLKVVGSKLIGTRRDWSDASFIVVKERAKLVRKMFDWSSKGWGYRRIALELKRRHVSPWGRAPWSPSTISKIIKSRAPLGEFQPHVYVDGAYGKRTPDGNPIKEYFPRIIDDDVWEMAQPNVTQHRAGRPAATLLSGLLVDQKGRPMHYGWSNNGAVSYVATSSTHLLPSEVPFRWRAQHLEKAVILIVQGINWSRVFSDQAQEPESRRLEDEVAKLNRMEVALQMKIQKAAAAFMAGDLGALGVAIKKQAEQFEADLRDLREKRAAVLARLDALRRTTQASVEGISSRTVPQEPDARRRLHGELKALLKKIQVWPTGRTVDKFWRMMLDEALNQTSPRATIARKAGRVMGAIRLYFANDKAITAYVTYLPGDRTLKAELLGFADPAGMTLTDWESARSHAGWNANQVVVESAVRG